MPKPPVFEGSDEKEPGLKTIQYSLLEGAEDDQSLLMSTVGPEVPYHLGWEAPHRHPHLTSRGLVGYRPLSRT